LKPIRFTSWTLLRTYSNRWSY